MVQRACALESKMAARIALVIGALLVALLAAPAPSFADAVAEKQAEAQAALQSLNTMLVELDEANAAYAAAVGAQEQAKLEVQRTQAEIDAQSVTIRGYQEQLGVRVRSMYRTGASSFFDVMFGATSFSNFATSWDFLTSMNAEDAVLIAQTKAEREKLGELRRQLAEQQQRADAAAAEAEAVRDAANETAARMQATYEMLSREAAELMAAQQAEAEARAAAEAAAAAQRAAQAYEYQYYTPSDGQAVSTTDIQSFDEGTGMATLSDGSTARVIGYDANTGNAIVDLAAQFVGGNYQWGAQDAQTATFDCSGLVQYVYQQNGITVGGHNDRAILNAGTVVDEPEPGDILWWDGHVAIYAGDNMMISADDPEHGITYREVKPGATYVRY